MYSTLRSDKVNTKQGKGCGEVRAEAGTAARLRCCTNWGNRGSTGSTVSGRRISGKARAKALGEWGQARWGFGISKGAGEAGAGFPSHFYPNYRPESRLLPATSSYGCRFNAGKGRRGCRQRLLGGLAVHSGALGAGCEAAACLPIGKEGASWERKAANANPEGSGCLDRGGREGPGLRKPRESARVCALPMQTCRPARGRRGKSAGVDGCRGLGGPTAAPRPRFSRRHTQVRVSTLRS